MLSVAQILRIPDINHAQYLVLKAFGSDPARFAELERQLPIPPVKVGATLANLVSKGLLEKLERGLYQINPAGISAIESVDCFYSALNN